MTSVAEPVAVVGMACRLPGADSPEEFWDLLVRGGDAVGPLPAGRWEEYARAGADHAAVVQRATARGGFLADVVGFDSAAFGLSPREADLMDPQQRILLEVAWDAVERAGVPADRLAGSDTGVFVGIGSDDYGRQMLEDLPSIEAWSGIGAALCAAANRLSYAFDLHGPSIAVDTACSASLVAIHLACQSLRQRECSVALAAGVNLVLGPGQTVSLDLAGVTAPDGRCKPFDAAADGYGRGEGCGVLVLRRWSDARRDGDPVLALIVGSAVHQDGRTSGIMAPSGPEQERLLRRSYAAAGVDPRTVDYVEAHGTGTPTGDPLEAAALAAVVGAGRPDGAPCLVGSVKSNIGHLEAAAGVAGVVKTVLAIAHGLVPATLTTAGPDPAIRWDQAGLHLVTAPVPWPDRGRPRRAGVSGFGYGGTTAHVVLEQPPAPADRELPQPAAAPAAGDGRTPRLFPLSSPSPAGLRADAARLADHVERAVPPLASLGYTLARRRSHLAYRAAVTAADPAELLAGLRAVAAGETGLAAPAPDPPPGAVWVFSGHGSQWAGMGRELAAAGAFAETVDLLDPVFAAELGRPLRQLLADDDLGGVDSTQPLIVAVQLGVAAVLAEHGARPDAVLGHSVGEITAAVVAGVLDPVAGATLACRRSRLLRRVAGRGAMAMVSLPFAEVERRLAGRRDVVAAVAAAPASTVIAGDAGAVAATAAGWRAEDVLVRTVATDVAFHSPHMDSLAPALAAAVTDLAPAAPALPLYSTALDDPRGDSPRDGRYWARNLRAPVRFRQAVAAAVEDGHRTFLEVSPHPVVVHSLVETFTGLGVDDAAAVGTLRRGSPELPAVLDALGALHCRGHAVDWSRLQPSGGLVPLPGRSWQHRRHWRESTPRSRTGEGHDRRSHALLGGRVEVAGEGVELWSSRLDERNRPYPGQHTLHDVHVVPAAVVLQTLLSAALTGPAPGRLTDVVLQQPLTLDAAREVQVVRHGDRLRISTRPETGGDTTRTASWTTHVIARLREPNLQLPTERPSGGAAGASGASGGVDRAPEVLGQLAAVGVGGAGFRWRLPALRRSPGGLSAHVEVPELPEQPTGTWAPLLDAALTVAATAGRTATTAAGLRVVAGVREVLLAGPPPDTALVRVVEAAAGGTPAADTVDIHLTSLDGAPIGLLAGVRFASLTASPAEAASLLHQVTWRGPDRVAGLGGVRAALLVGPVDGAAGGTAAALQHEFAGAGIRCGHADSAAAVPTLLADLTGPVAVVVLPPPGRRGTGEEVAAAARRSTWLLAETARQLVASGREDARVWVLTEGVRGGRDRAALSHAPLWGLARVIAGEHPEIAGGAVDLDPAGADPQAAARSVVAVLREVRDEPVVAIGPEAVAEVPRLAPIRSGAGGPGLTCRPDGSYLITGGLGALGLEVARWLVERGARRLLLATRRPVPSASFDAEHPDREGSRRLAAVRELEGQGATVRILAVDVADRAATRHAVAARAADLPPVRGVVHAAGVLDSRLLADLDEPSLARVMRPKVAGALVLHELFPPGTLDFFVLFSSCGQLLGMPGQASYAAANAFLDGLARHRGVLGDRAALSLGWTSWRGQGMAVDEVVDSELRTRGVGDITPVEAFGCWDIAAAHEMHYAAVLRVLPGLDRGRRPAALRDLQDTAGRPVRPSAPPTGLSNLAALDPVERRERLTGEVRLVAASVLKLSAADVEPRRPLAELGMDSVMALLIRGRLEQALGIGLPATLLWRRPTVAALAQDLADRVAPPAAPGAAAPGGPPGDGADAGSSTATGTRR